MSCSEHETARRYVHGVFCEDIRDEARGNQSLIGIFPGVLRLPPPFPSVIPKLAAIIWMLSPLNDPSNMDVQVDIPGGEPITGLTITADALGEIDPQIPDFEGTTRQQASAVIRMANLVIPQPGRLRLRVTAWGKTWTAASLAIIAAA